MDGVPARSTDGFQAVRSRSPIATSTTSKPSSSAPVRGTGRNGRGPNRPTSQPGTGRGDDHELGREMGLLVYPRCLQAEPGRWRDDEVGGSLGVGLQRRALPPPGCVDNEGEPRTDVEGRPVRHLGPTAFSVGVGSGWPAPVWASVTRTKYQQGPRRPGPQIGRQPDRAAPRRRSHHAGRSGGVAVRRAATRGPGSCGCRPSCRRTSRSLGSGAPAVRRRGRVRHP